MGLITALSATGLAAGLAASALAATGAHVAAASAPADITLPGGSILAQRVTTYCERVPDLQTRATKAQARLTGSADTKGSIAWLKAREAAQQKKGHTKVANRIDKVIQRRTARLAQLPTAESNLAQAKTQCSTLNLLSTSPNTPSSPASPASPASPSSSTPSGMPSMPS